MLKEEAMAMIRYGAICNCGGYAVATDGTPEQRARPHMDYCPQRQSYNDWYDAMEFGEVSTNQAPEGTKRWNEAMASVFKKGNRAHHIGMALDLCPYNHAEDEQDQLQIRWALGFRKAWQDGWMSEVKG